MRGRPKLDAAIASVRAVLARGEADAWSLRRLRAELRAAFPFCSVSRTTWHTAVVLATGRGMRGLKDPRHAAIARMRKARVAA